MTTDQCVELKALISDALPAADLSGAMVGAMAEAASIAELARMAAEMTVSAAADGRDAAFLSKRLEPVLDALRSRAGGLKEELERQWRRSCRA